MDCKVHQCFKNGIVTHPLVMVIIFGTLMRLIVSLFLTYPYDSSYWGMILENIQSGNDLYGLPGYYYTPVWGYFLSSVGFVSDFIFGVDNFGIHAYDFIFVNEVKWDYYKDLLISPEFSIILKIFLSMVDLLISYVLYSIILDHTGDRKKATWAFALWFLCPIVVYTSCVQVMFDGIAVLMMLLTVYFLMKDKCLLAGMAFCIAVLTKIFPVYLIFILVAYLIAKNRNDHVVVVKKVGLSVLGSLLMLLLIYLPVIIDGDISESFTLFTSRATGSGEYSNLWEYLASNSFLIVIVFQPIVFLLILWLARSMMKYRGDDLDRKFIMLSMLTTTSIFLWTPSPTYLLVIVPFLIMHVVYSDQSYKIPYVLMSVSPLVYSMSMHNYSIFMGASEYFNLISWDMIHDGILWFNTGIASMTYQDCLNIVAGGLETLAIYSIFVVFILNYRKSRRFEHGVV